MDFTIYLIFNDMSRVDGGFEGPVKAAKGGRFGDPGNWVYFCRPKNVEFMANHKATKKDVRQADKRRDRNRYNGKTTRNAIRDLRAIKVQKEAGDQLPEVASMIDKLAKKGVIHKNKAANLKSKLARKVNALAAAAK